MKIYNIRMEYAKTDNRRIAVAESDQPLFSWAVHVQRGEHPQPTLVTVSKDGRVLWQKQVSAQSVRYDGPHPEPGELCTLQLCQADGKGKGEAVDFCLGRLESWPAQWLCETQPRKNAVVRFVGDFMLAEKPVAACLFVCGLGYHKAYANGAPVLNDPLNPAYSEYEKRCYYSVVPGFEKYLITGKNRLGLRVGGGWRTPDNVCYNLVGRIAAYTGKTQASAAIRLRYADGRVQWITTGNDWRCGDDAVVTANLFDGETFDAAARQEDWSCPKTALEFAPVALADAPCAQMMPQTLEPVREQELYHAQTVCEVADGVWAVDFGQNIAGVCRLRIPTDIAAGTRIVLHHMEFLDEDGRLYLPQLRNAASVDTYIAAGDGRDPAVWQPEFTYHGFRYAEITGWPGVLSEEDITAVSLYTDINQPSDFVCGSPIITQIAHCARQTEKANIESILTDCPQRDERMGWLNDATVRFEATPYGFDVGRLFPKVVRDCLDVQGEDGSITCTAPFAFGSRPADPVCSSFLIAGWQAYLHTGNADILREAYPGFVRWNRFLADHAENNIVNYSYYGDWAAPAYACASEEYAVSAVTPGILMSTGYYYYNTCLLGQIAEVLGNEQEAENAHRQAAQIRAAFLEKWYDAASGKVATGSQGCQAFALWLDILPEEGRQAAADRLHEDLVKNGGRFTTGNLCTRYMMDVLSRFGYVEDAWQLAVREEYPSIGFMLQNEATTIWERFELKKNPLMNSHNHPMYGAVQYWYYAYLLGAKPVGAGWTQFSVAPVMPQKLLSASGRICTPYGKVCIRWVCRYGERHLYLEVPVGTLATVTLPWGGTEKAEPGFHHWSTVDDKNTDILLQGG